MVPYHILKKNKLTCKILLIYFSFFENLKQSHVHVHTHAHTLTLYIYIYIYHKGGRGHTAEGKETEAQQYCNLKINNLNVRTIIRR